MALAFTGESIARTFLVSGGSFAGLAVYGTTTKRSLSGLGQMLFMGLMGVVMASIVGLFWHSDALQFVLSFVGVFVFSGLTAYDAQRLKLMAGDAPAEAGVSSAAGTACTVIPGLRRARAETTTFSPVVSPSVTIAIDPTWAVVFTLRIASFPSGPTTPT